MMHAHIDALRERFLQSGDDADLPVVDAHHHFWDLANNYHPWLRDLPRIPFRYGDYAAICHDFLPDDYFAQAASHRVVKTVMMEGEWDARDPLGEARWASALNARTGLPNAMAGQIWLDREDVRAVLDGYRGLPLVRSVRHKPKTVPRAEHRADFSAAGSMRCERWRRGYALLAAYDLMFELQAPWWHFAEAAELARDFPDVKIIVNHTGLPADRSEEALRAWRAALDTLARWPNVWLKISGIGEAGINWSVERNGPVVREAIASFGVERCMFASNFPVDSLVVSLDNLFGGFKAMVAHRTPAERLALFHDNASALYRI
ncbi:MULTISPECIES: amidohydrolase family protein [unclassified Caballeronia]|uniref:amidohydrolase family protein n=1 Tax=unclassified Caballeronia TaxID=2646786 RepID=UPI002860EF17|nr:MULTISPECIES: amidohydrolase family protein [unclassified Caballeronia]MDR5774733.1 amidohydrolase family protein [Caballeronia sp. LZ002]MDR5850169.1 amidohydrolase family protein [Caballeronia sp. LZ003]